MFMIVSNWGDEAHSSDGQKSQRAKAADRIARPHHYIQRKYRRSYICSVSPLFFCMSLPDSASSLTTDITNHTSPKYASFLSHIPRWSFYSARCGASMGRVLGYLLQPAPILNHHASWGSLRSSQGWIHRLSRSSAISLTTRRCRASISRRGRAGDRTRAHWPLQHSQGKTCHAGRKTRLCLHSREADSVRVTVPLHSCQPAVKSSDKTAFEVSIRSELKLLVTIVTISSWLSVRILITIKFSNSSSTTTLPSSHTVLLLYQPPSPEYLVEKEGGVKKFFKGIGGLFASSKPADEPVKSTAQEKPQSDEGSSEDNTPLKV
ncbi:unnamed protein product [Leuciscus chuanchicus]